MNKLSLVLLCAALALPGCKAQAADKSAPPASVDQLLSMKDTPARMLSCYGLAGAGFGVVRSDIADNATTTMPFAASGTIGTIGAGCDLTVHRFVLGPWISYDFGRIEAEIKDPAGNVTLSVNNSLGLGGRLGYMVQATTLLYTSVGWVSTKAKAEVPGAGEYDDKLTGVRFGGGVETKLIGPLWFRFAGDWTRYNRGSFNADRVDATSLDAKASLMLRW